MAGNVIGAVKRGKFWLLSAALLLTLAAVPLMQQRAYGLSVSDNFDRSNGALGKNWTTVTGTKAPKIASNVLQAGTANAANSAYWSANTFGSNQFSQGNLTVSSGTSYGPGIAVRLSNSKGYYLWYGNTANTVSLWRMDSATSWTQLSSSSALTITPATDTWKIQAIGSTITGYQNGHQVVQATDTHYTTGSPGVWLYYAANKIDNWSGGDVSTYSIGGSVSGLNGTVILQNNGSNDLSVSANGAFTFSNLLASGSAYNATVKTNPAGQTCTVTNGSGTVGSSNITNVSVACTTNVVPTYSVGGSISGLNGSVTLQDNGTDDLAVNTNGSFTFATKIPSGSAYNVTVKSNPANQTCTITGGTGTIASANVTNISVACADIPGTSAADNFNRADGPLGSNWTDMAYGAMSISAQTVNGNAAGTTGDFWNANAFTSDQYSQVELTSAQIGTGQWIGPSVRSQNNGYNGYVGIYYGNGGSPELRLYKVVAANWTQIGSSYASGYLNAGTKLKVTVSGSTITFLQDGVARVVTTDTSITGGSPGIMSAGGGQADNWAGGNYSSGPSFTVGGTASGLNGTVTLQNNGADNLGVSANGSFTFANKVTTGSPYNVTTKTNPAGQSCAVANGAGTMGSNNITNVTVTCQNVTATGGSDDFNRANGTLGLNWGDDSDGGLAILNNEAAGTQVAAPTGDYRTSEVYSSDQYSQVQVSATQLSGSQWIGPAVRVQNGGQNAYIGIYNWNNGSPNLMVFKRTGLQWQQIGLTYNCGPLAAGTTLKLMAVGGTISFLQNGVERIAGYDSSYIGGSPGIQSFGTGHADNWSGGSAGFEVHYLNTDANGVDSYDIISANNGYGPQVLRILKPTNPAPGVKHTFIYTLPVAYGADNTTYGDGLDQLRSLNAQNQYNATIIEPSFGIDPWYADNPNDANAHQESFMANELQPWVKQNLASSGTEQHWLVGFSKSGIGGQDLILKHPDLFTLAASWDFPADMSAYDQFGTSSANEYGTDANFQANYRLTSAFIAAHKTPFQTKNRIWIGGYNLYGTDVNDYNTLLTANGIAHTTGTPTPLAHRWDSGWLPTALSALYQDSLVQ